MNYQDAVQDMLTSHKTMRCNVSLKIHFLEAHLDFLDFEYVRNKFPNMSDAKIKEGIFIGHQIRELMQDRVR